MQDLVVEPEVLEARVDLVEQVMQEELVPPALRYKKQAVAVAEQVVQGELGVQAEPATLPTRVTKAVVAVVVQVVDHLQRGQQELLLAGTAVKVHLEQEAVPGQLLLIIQVTPALLEAVVVVA
jgi:hypothetical protein